MSHVISKSEYTLWKTHPVSQAIIAYLDLSAKQIMMQWFNGAYVGEEGDKTLQLNAEALGRARVMQELMDRITNGKLDSILVLIEDKENENA